MTVMTENVKNKRKPMSIQRWIKNIQRSGRTEQESVEIDEALQSIVSEQVLSSEPARDGNGEIWKFAFYPNIIYKGEIIAKSRWHDIRGLIKRQGFEITYEGESVSAFIKDNNTAVMVIVGERVFLVANKRK